MSMKILNLTQGSDEWKAARVNYFTASEAPAMLGLSKYKSRDKLLREKATGITEYVDAAKQRLFDAGHEAEDAARPIVEKMIGEDLFPATGTREVEGLPLLASFDGINMAEDTCWENKLYRSDLAQDIEAGEIDDLYWPQLESQLLVSGAERVYFTASDGTEENTIGLWYVSVPARRQRLIAGWKQFKEDLANYKPVEVIPAAVAAPTEGFGALVLQVEGRVVACNIDAFRAGASAFLSRLPKPEELNSDQDFANAESAVKACSEAESKIKAAKDAGLAQMEEVDTVFRVADQIVAEIKAARIALEKSVEIRKASIRSEIVQSGKDGLAEHIATLNKRLGRVQMPAINVDFLAAIKGKRTVESLRNAVSTTLANAKITANEIADKIQINLATLDEHKEHAFLFNDVASLVMKAPDDLANVIKLRIAEHAAEQARKLEAERERIRKEEQARIAAEELRRMDAERKEQERIAAESAKQNTPPPVARSPESENAPALVRQAVSMSTPVGTSTEQRGDMAWEIAGLVAQMTGAEQKLVMHYCERIIEQRKEAA